MFAIFFSCCKVHAFCEKDLEDRDKCGGNLLNKQKKFEYDTKTCSKYILSSIFSEVGTEESKLPQNSFSESNCRPPIKNSWIRP